MMPDVVNLNKKIKNKKITIITYNLLSQILLLLSPNVTFQMHFCLAHTNPKSKYCPLSFNAQDLFLGSFMMTSILSHLHSVGICQLHPRFPHLSLCFASQSLPLKTRREMEEKDGSKSGNEETFQRNETSAQLGHSWISCQSDFRALCSFCCFGVCICLHVNCLNSNKYAQ